MGSMGIVERMAVKPDNLYYREHVARYALAKNYVKPGLLLDIASGTGYGSELLQPICQALVVGIDIDLPSLISARQTYPGPHIAFLAANGTAIPFQDATFNTITSMETLEHIQDDKGFLGELSRVLRQDGTCIISTPNHKYSLNHGITNPYHVWEYNETELVELISVFFQSVKVFYQGFEANYHANVRNYSDSIQTQKEKIPSILRWGINHIYRPIKRIIPASITNYSIHKLLELTFPQPKMDDIIISDQPIQDCSNFVVICHKTAK